MDKFIACTVDTCDMYGVCAHNIYGAPTDGTRFSVMNLSGTDACPKAKAGEVLYEIKIEDGSE